MPINKYIIYIQHHVIIRITSHLPGRRHVSRRLLIDVLQWRLITTVIMTTVNQSGKTRRAVSSGWQLHCSCSPCRHARSAALSGSLFLLFFFCSFFISPGDKNRVPPDGVNDNRHDKQRKSRINPRRTTRPDSRRCRPWCHVVQSATASESTGRRHRHTA